VRLQGLKIENMLELGIMKGGSVALFNALLRPTRHMAIDIFHNETGLTRLAQRIKAEGRSLLTHTDVSQADTARIA
jgi:hypothetical protein